MTPFVIRDATPADIDAVGTLEERCFALPWTRELLARQLADGSHVLLCADCDGVTAGYAGFSFVLDEGYVGNVAVLPEYRRQGLGRALTAAMLRRAEALGLAFLTLEVRQSNLPAIALYERQGFLRVGLRTNYYERPMENAILMTAFLKTGAEQGEKTC